MRQGHKWEKRFILRDEKDTDVDILKDTAGARVTNGDTRNNTARGRIQQT
jgi:hypothetical protein